MKRFYVAALPAVFAVTSILWSCHITDDPHFLRHPFKEYANLPGDTAGYQGFVWGENAADGCLMYYTTDSYSGVIGTIIGMAFWDGENLVQVPAPSELTTAPEYPFQYYQLHYTFRFDDSMSFGFVYSLDEDGVGRHYHLQRFTLETDGVSGSLSLDYDEELMISDFPSMTDWGSCQFAYTDGRLYMASDYGDSIVEGSYAVTAEGISDPKESFTVFPGILDIVEDYFVPITGADTFWGTGGMGSFSLIEMYHSPDSDTSLYLLHQADNLTNEGYYVIVSWDGEATSGMQVVDPLTFYGSLDQYRNLNILKTSGLVATEVQSIYEGINDIVLSGFDMEKQASIQLSGLSFYKTAESETDGELLLFTSETYTGEGEITIYGLPVSYILEEGAIE